MAKDVEINPHAKEAWKVTKSTVKGNTTNCTISPRIVAVLLLL